MARLAQAARLRRWLPLCAGLALASGCTLGGPGHQVVPAPGGKVVVASWQEQDSLLACNITAMSAHACAYVNPVMEGLLTVRPAAAVPHNPKPADYWAPQLAVEVPTEANGEVKVQGGQMTVTWKLRSGVRWHDGLAFTSQDVKATFEFFWLRFRDHNPTPLASTSGWDQVESVDTPNPQTAVVRFTTVFAPYLTLGTGPYGILPAHLLEQVWQRSGDVTREKVTVNIPGAFSGSATLDHVLVGTGPFMFKEWVAGSHLTLVRNPHWWGGHQPYLDAIEVKFDSDPNTELTDLQNGTIDLALDLRASLLPALLNRVPDANPVVIPASASEHLDLNLHNPFLQDVAVRRAILMGIDRQKLVDTLLVGKTSVPPDAWMCLGTGAWCLDPAAARTGYDVDGANSLLDQAGYKLQTDGACKGYRADGQGRCLQLHIASTALPLRSEEEIMLAADLARIGVQVVQPFDNVPASRLFGSCVSGGLIYSHTFDLALYASGYSAPAEPDSLAYPTYHSSEIPTDSNGCQGQNTTYVSDANLDAALDLARHTVDMSARRADYVRAQQVLGQLVPDIPLYQGVQVEASLKRLQGYRGNEFWWMNNTADWYVNTTTR